MINCPFRGCAHTATNKTGIEFHCRTCPLNPRVLKHQALIRRELTGEEALDIPSLPPQLGGTRLRLPVDAIVQSGMGIQLEKQNDLASKAALDREAVAAALGRPPDQRGNLEQEKDAAAMKCVQTVGVMLAELAEMTGSESVENLISAITNDLFSLTAFKEHCSSLAHCRHIATSLFRERIEKDGFVRQDVKMKDGPSYEVYSRNPVHVLQKQLEGAGERDFIPEPFEMKDKNGNVCFSHPMTTRTAFEVHDAVRAAVQQSSDTEVSWWSGGSGGSVLESFVGFGQLYSDKSVTSLKAESLKFYPVHATFLNFSEAYRRDCIEKGRTVVGYLPTELRQDDEDEEALKKARPLQMRALHGAMKEILTPLISVAESGFKCEARDGVPRLCHFALYSVCCDLPESKDLSSVTSGMTCLRCHCPKEEMNSTNFHEERTFRETLAAQESSRSDLESCILEFSKGDRLSRIRAANMKKRSKTVLADASVSDQAPFFKFFPFTDVHHATDVHKAFSFEPMHNFHLGISKLLKLCAAERLQSSSIRTSRFLDAKKQPKTLGSIRTVVLNTANSLLRRWGRESHMRGVNVDFSTMGKGNDFNGFFKKDGVMGMLQVTDMAAIDMVAPFIGAFIDRCCGESRTAPTSTVFTMYNDLVRSCMRYGCESAWTEKDVLELELRISQFKKNSVLLYAEHQASAMGTLKFHMLEHIGEDVRRMGGLVFGHAGLYEYSHTIFKAMYRSTSKRKRVALGDSVRASDRRDAFLEYRANRDVWADKEERKRKVRRVWPSRKESVEGDIGALVRDGVWFTVGGIVKARRLHLNIEESKRTGNANAVQEFQAMYRNLCAGTREMYRAVGHECAAVLPELLTQELVKIGNDIGDNVGTVPLVKVKSGFVAGHIPPNATNYRPGRKSITFPNSNMRLSQRVVSSESYYGKAKFDRVMVEGRSSSGEREIWFGQVLALFRAESKALRSNDPVEFCVLQYYDVVKNSDNVDRALKCVKLRWYRKDSRTLSTDTSTSSKFYGLVPLAAVCGTIHVVRVDTSLLVTKAPGSQKNHPWEQEEFYVNRFYRDPEEVVFEADANTAE